LLDASAGRPSACVHGLAAVALIWLLLFAAAVGAAQMPQPRQWDRQSALALLAYIDTIDAHGLDPADYAPTDLHAALNSGDPAAIERQATASFGLVARDLATGHLRPQQRGRYFIPSDTLSAAQVADLIDRALARQDVAGTLEGGAPRDPQYAALRAALAKLRPGRDRERRIIEANLERWRWLPRELGERYLLINIPEFQLRLFDGGRVTSSHRVIVGEPNTPTPQFRTEATGVIFNPPWNVPQSIIAESIGSLVRNRPAVARARGYTWSFADGGLRVTQQPGPQNALGQMKLDMPNPFTVFIHDTATKQLFAVEDRALSHGCIRTQAPFDLAAALLAGTEWTPSQIAGTVAGLRTERAPLPKPVPVYVVYMTAVADDYGTVRFLDDPYKLDKAIEERLAQGDIGAPALAALDHETECRLAQSVVLRG
jgi:murein L,D-transpeptidase YcbB/YkuD